MFRAELSERTDNISTAVLCEGAWNDFEGTGEGLVGPLVDTFDGLCLLQQSAGELHLKSAATGAQARVHNDIAGDTEGVMQVALNLVEDVLAGTSKQDRASLGVLTLSHEGEVVVANFLDLEEATLGADVTLLDLLRAVNNGRTRAASHSVVVSLTQTAEDSAVALLEQVVLSSVRDTLFGDDNIGSVLQDSSAHSLDLDLLHGESLLEVGGISELHGGHGFTLLVLEGAIEEDDTGVADHAAHIGVGDVLVEHNTVKHLAVLNHAARNLLDLGVPLGVNLDVLAIHFVDSADSLDGKVNDEAAPLGSELGADAAIHNLGQVLVVLHVNGVAQRLSHMGQVIKSLEVGADNDSRVDVTLQEALDGGKDFTGHDDD